MDIQGLYRACRRCVTYVALSLSFSIFIHIYIYTYEEEWTYRGYIGRVEDVDLISRYHMYADVYLISRYHMYVHVYRTHSILI